MNSTGDEAYGWLIAASKPSDCDAFDIHVAASILALALCEPVGEQGEPAVNEGSGLTKAELEFLAEKMFPQVVEPLVAACPESDLKVDEEEQSLRDILLMYASGAGWLTKMLAFMIARRCKQPHHLWQDLGLRNRGELSELMERHFTRLSARNREDMKWKKFLYRMVCGSEGFTLCTTPVCSDCNDFEMCFGDESGESRLARIANSDEPVVSP